jgi:hypothetical protein
MGYTAKLFTLSGLSVELNRDRRTVGKALARVAPDGKTASGDDGWYLTTTLGALERIGDRRRGNGDGSYADDAALVGLERAAAAVDDFLGKLRAEPDIDKRRAFLRADGGVIGAFVEALDRVREGHGEPQRQVEGPFCDKMVGEVIAETLHLCELTLDAA